MQLRFPSVEKISKLLSYIIVIALLLMIFLCCDVLLCPALCDLMVCSPPGSSVHGISQAIALGYCIQFSLSTLQILFYCLLVIINYLLI